MKTIRNELVGDIMTESFEYVGPNIIMTEVAQIFDNFSFHHLPVLDEQKRPLGVISRHDYFQLQHHFTHFGWKNPEANNRSFFSTLVSREVMSKVPVTLKRTDKVGEAIDIFLENRIHSILVVEGETCVGVLTPYDILKTLHLSAA